MQIRKKHKSLGVGVLAIGMFVLIRVLFNNTGVFSAAGSVWIYALYFLGYCIPGGLLGCALRLQQVSLMTYVLCAVLLILIAVGEVAFHLCIPLSRSLGGFGVTVCALGGCCGLAWAGYPGGIRP